MSKKWLELISIFETNLSAAEWAWRIMTFAVIVAGGTTTGLLAKGSAYFSQFGLLGWIGVGLFSALLMALILFLVKLSNRQSAEAEYIRSMANQSTSVNPLLDSFTDQIIRIEDLHLPIKQLHENKHFKRCKFVGPGAIAILGGNYISSNFYESGDIVALPDECALVGIVVLQNCTVENCEFYKITLFTSKPIAQQMKKMGWPVAGI